MRSILKILLVPAAIGLGATAANAAPGNAAAPAPASVDAGRTDQNVVAVRDGGKKWRKPWRKQHKAHKGHRWDGRYAYRPYRYYRPYSYYYYPGYYPYSYYYGPSFNFSIGF